MRTLGLAIKPGIEQALVIGGQISKWALAQGLDLLVEKVSAQNLGISHNPKISAGVSAEQLISSSEVVATLGGDGTFLGIARHVSRHSPILVGVNFGTLGFLTEFTAAEAIDALGMAFMPQPKVAVRSMLSVIVQRSNHVVFNAQALNDAVFLKEARERLLDLDVNVDNKFVARFRADGLIVATPTGSTAYSLAAGGSIVVPELPVTLVTPVCPHSLTARPFIVDINSTISIEIPAYDGSLYLNVDGQLSHELRSGDIVTINKSPHHVRYIKSPTKSYFDILRTKLNWGIANNN